VKRWYDNVARGSEITADVYVRRLSAFCDTNSTSPTDLLKLTPKEIRDMLLDMVTKMEKAGNAGSYVKSNVKAVKSWLSYNEIEIKNRIKIRGVDETPSLKDEKVPSRDELRKIFLAADLQNRTADSLMAHGGFRPEILGNYAGDDGLEIGDFPEMEVRPRKREISFSKTPTIVIVRKELSKSDHQFFTMLTGEACRYLKEYLEQRMRDGEVFSKKTPIINPKKDSKHKKALGSHVKTTNIGDMVRKSIRAAGFGWRPYVLRAYFDSQLLIAENNGKIAKDYRAFFMGHKGDIESKYTTNKNRLSTEMIEDMRLAYKKASEYLVTEKTADAKNESELKKLFLLASKKFTMEEIEKERLAELPYEDLQKVVLERFDKNEAPTGKTEVIRVAGNNSSVEEPQIVVPVGDVKRFLPQGYKMEFNLGNGEAVLTRTIANSQQSSESSRTLGSEPLYRNDFGSIESMI